MVIYHAPTSFSCTMNCSQENGGCGFFEWCDSASVTNLVTYGSQNRASSSSFSDLQCPCGAGSCIILTAKTGENVGQQFYRCPSYQVIFIIQMFVQQFLLSCDDVILKTVCS